jgi:hypothetical protein
MKHSLFIVWLLLPSFCATAAEFDNVPAIMSLRFSEESRAKASSQNGGKIESEKAVLRGLRFLLTAQSPDGSWGKTSKAAMVGFGLLSFLGHGETPDSPEFGPTVTRAIDWLLKSGEEFDGRLSMEPKFTATGVYSHAIVTYALCEYYSITKDERVVELLRKAIDYILVGQGPDGGWMYGYDKSSSDTSVSGWQMQALKAAFLTELKIEGVEAALDNGVRFLRGIQGPKGGFGYRQPDDRYSLTGVGVYCTYFWTGNKNQTVRDGIAFMMDQTGKAFPVQYKHQKADLYAWYYNTQACFLAGGATWDKWNGVLQDQIVGNQSPNGSWPPVAGKAYGGELQLAPDGDGPFYRTNLCILMLEVYYRYGSWRTPEPR